MRVLPVGFLCVAFLLASLLGLGVDSTVSTDQPVSPASQAFAELDWQEIRFPFLAEDENLAQMVQSLPQWILDHIPDAELVQALKEFKEVLEERQRLERITETRKSSACSMAPISWSIPPAVD
jgi:hypothetical protein